jgi:16S rRNA (uracil1498-N3)-methyltransferase
MAAPWFFVAELPAAGGAWRLSRDEARHALGSKRLAAGDPVVLFDGRGGVAEAALGAARDRDGSVPVEVRRVRRDLPSGRRVHLLTALPKGDRLATLVDMTAQLGVASVTPIRFERSVVGETLARSERMRRIQIEACKQSRCPWLPELREERALGELVAERWSADRPLLVCDALGDPIASLGARLGNEVTVCVGPEGGLTDAERDALSAAGAVLAALAATVLRIETAATVAVAMLR